MISSRLKVIEGLGFVIGTFFVLPLITLTFLESVFDVRINTQWGALIIIVHLIIIGILRIFAIRLKIQRQWNKVVYSGPYDILSKWPEIKSEIERIKKKLASGTLVSPNLSKQQESELRIRITKICKDEKSKEHPSSLLPLIEQGADIKGRHLALFNLRKSWDGLIAAILIEFGANINENGEYGMTPINHGAYHLASPYLFHALIRAGADINARDEYGKTALMNYIIKQSFFKRNLFAYFTLIAYSDPNIQDNEGKTALMWAIRYGRSFVARFIIKNKANITIKDNGGKTALDYAIEKKDKRTISHLKKLMI